MTQCLFLCLTLLYRTFFSDVLYTTQDNLVPRAFPLKNGWGREKALASAGHVSSLNIHINGNV